MGKIKTTLKSFIEKIMYIYGINLELNLEPFLEGIKVNVIDIGARGGYHKRWEQLGDNGNLYLFEPDIKEYENLKNQYSNRKNVYIFNNALSENGETLTLYIPNWPDSSSVFCHDQDFLSKTNFYNYYELKKTIEISSQKLDNILDNEIDFIKIDAEGSELSILKGGTKIIQNCIGAELEVSFNSWAKGLPLFGDIDVFMKSKNFILSKISEPSNYHYLLSSKDLEAHGIVFSTDVLYLKSPFYMFEEITKNGANIPLFLKSIAIYLCYGNYEYAYVLLQEMKKVNIEESLYLKTINLITLRSGYKKLFTYNWIRRNRFIPKLRVGLDY